MNLERLHQFIFLILLAGRYVVGDSSDTDKQVLLDLKSFLEDQNHVDRGKYTKWIPASSSHCTWPGISCNNGSRVTGIDLSNINISGDIYGNFSALTALTSLDLSGNSLNGPVPADLGLCRNLKFLNMSHNIIAGELNFTGLDSIEVLDLSENRIEGKIQSILPRICNRLVVANISGNKLSGEIGKSLDGCLNLQHVDFSYNFLTGNITFGFQRLKMFLASRNNLSGTIQPRVFSEGCSLEGLDLSENSFVGELPKEISHCKNLEVLNLWGDGFTGKIPNEIGSLVNLQALIMGRNSFDRDIPGSFINLTKLSFLDLSGNNFGGDLQHIFGQTTQVKFLLLHGNSYTNGIYSSGILKLPNISRIDLSNNNFSGQLPVEFSQMLSVKYLFLSSNQFTGNIPPEYGNFQQLQALDLSYNKLNGSIPQSLGNLKSLLWLMLASNELSGEIPPELGNCSSMLWLNLANNQISGKIPPELASIGNNPMPTFQLNRQSDQITAGSGECSAMKRWLPANYPPFSFVYTLLTMKKCRSLWDTLLKGYGLFSICSPGTNIRTYQISGYMQLGDNQLSGELPREIEKMQNFSMLHLANNRLEGTFPAKIKNLPLLVLNITGNNFSGEIPEELGRINCLQSLDLSYNNFSGEFPPSLSNLNELNKFNISYNRYISGVIPSTGQFATFEKWSYVGDPLLRLPPFLYNKTNDSPTVTKHPIRTVKSGAFLVFIVILIACLVLGIMGLAVCVVVKSSPGSPSYMLEDSKVRHVTVSSSGGSSPWFSDGIKIIRLDKTAFTHKDILVATGNFSNERIIGRGGFGTVYRGVLPDGREVAVKKQQRQGVDGEREFRAEMEVLTGNGFGWPHPNLVTLYGWCLDGSEKLLVYEYMVGGTLEDLISNRMHFTWRQRIDVALDVARALFFLHHECDPAIVHRDVKASNVLLDKDGKARVTDFGLARVVDAGVSHVSTMVAGTVGYVAPEYGQTWQATTKGDVYSYGVLIMELATGRRAVDGGEECLVEWARRVMGYGQQGFSGKKFVPVALLVSGLREGGEELRELLKIGIRCTAEAPQARPNMKERELTESLAAAIKAYPKSTAVLVRNHGVYIWGDSWISAKTQAECYHYLFEAAIKLHQLGLDCSTPNHGPIQSFKGLSNVDQSVNMSVKAGNAISNNGFEPSHRCIVLDIEGTTTPISFVTDVLFPYARENVGNHLDATYDSAETQDDIKLLRAQVEDDLKQGIVGALPIPPDSAGKEEVVAALVANVEAMIKADRKITSLKQLQGHIWRTGFQKSEIEGIVFDDVPEALENWHALGIKVYIYSSGSRLAQRLLFGYTNYGDLRKYLCGYFDTTVGNKKETRSYVEISEYLGVHKPSDILFVTDVYQEGVAAKTAGLDVIISVRPGNGPLPENHEFKTVTSFSEI